MASAGSEAAPSPGEWQNSFNWEQGQLEVMSDGVWGGGRILDQDSDKQRVKVSYSTGAGETEEWLERSSSRLRPAADSGPKAHADGGKAPKAEAPSERPMRRSRLVADDARFAQELQEQEMRGAYRAVPKVKAPKQAAAPKEKESKGPSKRGAAGAAKGGSTVPAGGSAAGGGKGTKRTADVQEEAAPPKKGGRPKKEAVEGKKVPAADDMAGKQGKGKTPNGAGAKPEAPVITTASKSIPKSPPRIVADKPGKVSFVLAPSDGGTHSAVLPAMKMPKHVMDEDTTVHQIKRMVVDQVMPGESTSNLALRTPAGMQLGNDHSLKFVRSFLWPPAKGQLYIFYSKETKAFF